MEGTLDRWREVTRDFLRGAMTREQYEREVNVMQAPQAAALFDAFPGSRLAYDEANPPPVGPVPPDAREGQGNTKEVPMDAEGRCPSCHQTVAEYSVTLNKVHCSALAKAHAYVLEGGPNPLEVGALRGRLTPLEYSSFAVLALFGLTARAGPGLYSLDPPAVAAFLQGSRRVPSTVWRNPATGAIRTGEELVTINDVPGSAQVREALGRTMTTYST